MTTTESHTSELITYYPDGIKIKEQKIYDENLNLINKILFHENGKIHVKQWYQNDKLHREDGPALIWYFDNCDIYYEEWHYHDKLHRLDGPALTIYYPYTGQISSEQWYYHGKKHRNDKPACIKYNENGQIEYEEWYYCNKLRNLRYKPNYIQYNYDHNGKLFYTNYGYHF
jgi:antitoxin component YwqK of YwqJK toxin-antitoxin module